MKNRVVVTKLAVAGLKMELVQPLRLRNITNASLVLNQIKLEILSSIYLLILKSRNVGRATSVSPTWLGQPDITEHLNGPPWQ